MAALRDAGELRNREPRQRDDLVDAELGAALADEPALIEADDAHGEDELHPALGQQRRDVAADGVAEDLNRSQLVGDDADPRVAAVAVGEPAGGSIASSQIGSDHLTWRGTAKATSAIAPRWRRSSSVPNQATSAAPRNGWEPGSADVRRAPVAIRRAS